jgi:hypothetical protein
MRQLVQNSNSRHRPRGWVLLAIGMVLLVTGSAYDFWHLGKSEQLIDEAIANNRLPVSTYRGPLDAIRGVPNIVGFVMVIIGTVILVRSGRNDKSRGTIQSVAKPTHASEPAPGPDSSGGPPAP